MMSTYLYSTTPRYGVFFFFFIPRYGAPMNLDLPVKVVTLFTTATGVVKYFCFLGFHGV
ncbi:hypothetical protein B0T09DRAFT_343555 [Sordaria sp. MPI-SDFR-AT-0083]|nr:hypothetical protein B0T09DRAFT_343555 [Sordaria sp. MPI-SDFR-AT-0083]